MFNCEKFVKDTKERHLNSGEILMFDGLKHVDVRNIIDLDGTYDYETGIGRYTPFNNLADDKVILQRSLDAIYNNIVWQTLLKLLTVKCGLSGRKIGLVNYSGNGSCYDETGKAVFVNLSLYQSDGSGISRRQYYSVDPGRKIALKQKSLEQSIFHELAHGLHYVSDGQYADTVLCQDGSVMEEIWSDDEELRTIVGYMCGQPYDPICDHIFDYSLRGSQFCPRYGHIGWQNGCDRNPPILVDNLADQMVYLKGWEAYELPDSLPLLKSPQVSKKVKSRGGRYRLSRKLPKL
jgi:hypothetical protein